MANLLEPLVQNKGLDLKIVNDCADTLINTDRRIFKHIFFNLLLNAVDYAEDFVLVHITLDSKLHSIRINLVNKFPAVSVQEPRQSFDED